MSYRKQERDPGVELAYQQKIAASNEKLANEYEQRGQIHEAFGDYLKAIEDYKEAIRLDSAGRELKLLGLIGYCYFNIGFFDQALEAFDVIIQNDPDNGAFHYSRGLTLQEQGVFDLALEAYKTAIEKSPDYAAAHNNKGVIYERLGYFELALESYTTIINMYPKDELALINRCCVLFRLGRLEEAKTACEEASALTADPHQLAKCERLAIGIKQAMQAKVNNPPETKDESNNNPAHGKRERTESPENKNPTEQRNLIHSPFFVTVKPDAAKRYKVTDPALEDTITATNGFSS